DPELEAELIARLMVRLGAPEGTARPAVQAALAATPAPSAAPRARRVQGVAVAALEMDDGFDRAWRRLGLVLDRSGFSVEDRDRSAGVYFVRYVDPKEAQKAEPGFFTRLFGSGTPPAPNRYRIFVKAVGDKTAVSILNANGSPDNSEVAGRIVERLVNELK
ncbi:MAG: outer membrane protein assembly factor BamC, partial [Rubrivivax sp.]